MMALLTHAQMVGLDHTSCLQNKHERINIEIEKILIFIATSSYRHLKCDDKFLKYLDQTFMPIPIFMCSECDLQQD